MSVTKLAPNEATGDVATESSLVDQALDVLDREFSAVVQQVLGYQTQASVEVCKLASIEVEERLNVGDNDDVNATLLNSFIRLDGDELCSELFVTGSPASVKEFCPFPISGAEDWIGELANLLMGSLKNSLSGYRVECCLGLPELSTGLKLPADSSFQQMIFGVRTDTSGWLIVGLEYTLNPIGSWQFDPQVAAADDGDVCLF